MCCSVELIVVDIEPIIPIDQPNFRSCYAGTTADLSDVVTTLITIRKIVLNARAGVMQINHILLEKAQSFGAIPWAAFNNVYALAALA